MQIYTIGSLSEQSDLHYVSEWKSEPNSVPIFRVDTPHAFNRVIGYARYKNGTSGTVLYRGQNKLYGSLLPSGARSGKSVVTEQVFSDICNDRQISKFFGLDRKEIKGWKEYNHMLIEAVLQHYGANTYCMDFVDNHWCSLWFGLYKFDRNHYYKRSDDGYLYIFLYVAETEGPCVGGMYIGDTTYTVDLRKALPSTFQRPASQHGWVVRQKERKDGCLDDHVVGIIEISVKNARDWLGNGELLSEENFFPSYMIDQGYKVLLSRQHRSGIFLNKETVLPQNTIRNYHMHEMIYCSDFTKLSTMKVRKRIPKEINITNPMDLFEILLNVGWDGTTYAGNSEWSEKKPYVGQSAVTSLLLQSWFGGEICVMNYGAKSHYFNIVEGIIVDFTRGELQDTQVKKCYNPSYYIKLDSGRKLYEKNKKKVARLINNCKKHLAK